MVVLSLLLAMATYSAYAHPNAFHVIGFLGLVVLALDKATWLPFLGEAAMPVSLFTPRIPSRANQQIELKAPPAARRIVYWASDIPNAKHPSKAYGTNAGVSDIVDGIAVIVIRAPYEYSIRGHRISKHVHYRWIYGNGLLSDVKTLFNV